MHFYLSKSFLISFLVTVFVTLLSFLAFAQDPFIEYLKSQGRTSYEYAEKAQYVREHTDKYVAALYPDVQNLAEWMLQKYPMSEYFFIDIGSGPAPLGAYLSQRQGVMRANLPLSGFGDAVDERGFFILNPLKGQDRILPVDTYVQILTDHFARFIPQEALDGQRKILLIDTVQSGTTLLNAHRRILNFVHAINPNIQVEALGLVHPDAVLTRKPPFGTNESESEMNLRLRSFRFINLNHSMLGWMLHNRTLQEFAEHTRFEPGREASVDVKPNLHFSKVSSAMRSEMMVHHIPVLKSPSCQQFFMKP